MNKTVPRIVRAANRHLHARFQTTQPLAVLDPSKTIVPPPASNTHTDGVKTYYPSYEALETASHFRTCIAEKRTFDFFSPNLKLRTWLPDEIYIILEQYPTRIPSSLPGIDPENRKDKWLQLAPLPESEAERETFLENERQLRPRELLYRFYACGGFWLCAERDITHFLQSFSSGILGDMVPFLRQVLRVKIQHYVLPFNPNPRQRLTTIADPKYSLPIYNELFRALAWHGRDAEFLSLWDEAKDLGVDLDWYSYTSLFRCFHNSPTNRFREAIDAFHLFRKNAACTEFQKAILASSLISLILRRIIPGVLDANLTFDKILDLTLLLSTWVNNAAGVDLQDRLNAYMEKLTTTQRRIVLYFRLCARLQQAPRVIEFYHKSKAKGIKFTPMMYSFALFGVSHDPQLFPAFTNTVLKDMSMEGCEPDAEHYRALLIGACHSHDVAAALECFRKIELGYAIYLLIRTYHRPGVEGVTRNAWKVPSRSSTHPVHPFVKEGNRVTQKWRIPQRIHEATSLPFSFSEAPTTWTESIIQCISLMWYLSRRYPQHFTTPQVYNNYLSFAIGWRLNSVEAIFRDCFNHFPLSIEKLHDMQMKAFSTETHSRFKFRSRCSWHWPLQDISSITLPFLPDELPRPDKFTFVRAMEFAYFRRMPTFAREVWARREAWRTQIDQEAKKDLENIQWSEVNDDDILRYESYLVDKMDRGWVHQSLKSSEESEGAANNLYEGYIRLLYIEILMSGKFFDEAFEMILEGTGERYHWTQGMLAKVHKVAKFYDQKRIFEYIEKLEESGMEMERESPDDWWEFPA